MACHPMLQDPLVFSKIELFKSISFSEIESCLNNCKDKLLKRNEVLLSPEEENAHIYILLSGHLSIHLNSPDEPPLNLLQPGECVGEMSIIDRLEPSAYVVAKDTCAVLLLPQEVLWDMINATPIVAKNLLCVLSSRLRYEHEMLSNSVKQQKHLLHEASVDSLTGIHNRRWFDDSIRDKIQQYQTLEESMSILLIDIDHFKIFNDEFGHQSGDQVICKVADVLKKNLRKRDLLARFGGDEFIVALLGTETQGAMEVARRIKAEAKLLSVQYDNHKNLPSISVTIGVTTMKPDDNFQILFERADKALYEAKNRGRNCIEFIE